MRVLHVEAGMNLYGGPQQVVYLLRGLRDAGIENVLVCPRGSEIAAAAARWVDKCYAVKMVGDLDVGLIWRLKKIFRIEKPDIVHLHSRRGADILGGIAAKLAGIKTVLSRRVDNREPWPLVLLKYRLYDKIVTISEGIRGVLVAEGVAPEKIACVPSAVDGIPYQRPCDSAWFRQTFGLIPEQSVIGIVAQFIERKGHRYLLDAMPEVLEHCPATRLLVFGKGSLESRIREQIVRLGLEHSVIIAGFRTDLHRILGCLDLLVHPAEMEGLGVSLLEAASAGVPIIAARTGGIPEVVHDGENGVLVPPADVQSLSSAIRALLLDPHRRRLMGMKGKALVERSFSIPAMVAGNLKVYEAIGSREHCAARSVD